jgi:hypothetical protein
MAVQHMKDRCPTHFLPQSLSSEWFPKHSSIAFKQEFIRFSLDDFLALPENHRAHLFLDQNASEMYLVNGTLSDLELQTDKFIPAFPGFFQ